MIRKQPISRDTSFPFAKIEAIVKGDHDAFQELYYTYSDSIIFFLNKLLSSQDAAKDVAQETFATLWEKRDQIDTSKNIKGYLFVIARNASFRYIRRNSVYETMDDDFKFDHEHGGQSDEEIIARETQLLIRIAVSRMPSLRRSIYTMSREEGISNEEIAARLGISRESVASHLYNSLKDIREVIVLFIAIFSADLPFNGGGMAPL